LTAVEASAAEPMDANRRLSHGRGELSYEQGCVMVEDGPGAIEELMDLDPSLGIAAPMGEDLEDVWPVRHLEISPIESIQNEQTTLLT
jgi:hypothetical protein